MSDWDRDEEDPGTRQSNRSKVISLVVLGIAVLGSIVLCCMLAGNLGELNWLPLPRP